MGRQERKKQRKLEKARLESEQQPESSPDAVAVEEPEHDVAHEGNGSTNGFASVKQEQQSPAEAPRKRRRLLRRGRGSEKGTPTSPGSAESRSRRLPPAPPPAVGIVDAVNSHKFTFAFVTLLVLAAGIAYGLVRTPTYEAESTLQVSLAAPSPAGLPGAVSAAQQFADTFARATSSTQVINSVSRATGLPPDQVASELSAEPVPQTAIINVFGTSESDADAVALSTSGSDAIIEFARSGAAENLRGNSLFRQFKKASNVYEARLQDQQKGEREFNSKSSSVSASDLEGLRSETQAALVKRDALQQAYQNSQQLFTAPVKTVSKAQSASSDRISKLEFFGFTALVVGMVLGAALVLLRANRRARRPA